MRLCQENKNLLLKESNCLQQHSPGKHTVTSLMPRLALTETQKTVLLLQSLKLLRHEVLHLLYVHASPALWKCPYRSVPILEQTQDAYHRIRKGTLKKVNRRTGLTSYWACKFRAFWLKKPKTLEKCSLRISLNTCERTRQKSLTMTDLNQAPACLRSTITAQEVIHKPKYGQNRADIRGRCQGHPLGSRSMLFTYLFWIVRYFYLAEHGLDLLFSHIYFGS